MRNKKLYSAVRNQYKEPHKSKKSVMKYSRQTSVNCLRLSDHFRNEVFIRANLDCSVLLMISRGTEFLGKNV